MVAVIAGLAKATPTEEQDLARFALLVILANTLLVAVMGVILVGVFE